MHQDYQERFDRELKVSLIGISEPISDWPDIALLQVKMKCYYLINIRGFDGWSL
jgi:hypothetical protein